MNEEAVREQLRRAFQRGYRTPGPGLSDRIFREVFGNAPGATTTAEGGRRARPVTTRAERRRGRWSQWLGAAAAAALALLAVTTLLGIRYAGTHRPSTPAGRPPAALADEAATRQLARTLLARSGGSVTSLRAAGRSSQAAARDDATVASYLDRERAFAGYPAVAVELAELEREAPALDSGDAGRVALAAAVAQRGATSIHSALLSGMPPKAIVVSLQAQQLWAYDHGHLLLSTLVTAGSARLPTAIGPLSVLRKSHPWTMRSPWPPGSPDWYPDMVVQYFIWLTEAGDGLHDALWQPCCYGPGSESSPYASHGTIHVPLDAEATLYLWADVGTPVVVYPGGGAPVPQQVAAISAQR
jgi:hypothetical protein